MATRKTLNISLTRRLEKFISDNVASGRYQSASEVVRDGLRLLEERQIARKTAMAEFKKKIDVGLAEARRGELVDADIVLRKIERNILNRRRRKAG